jgi:hypothetical protein
MMAAAWVYAENGGPTLSEAEQKRPDPQKVALLADVNKNLSRLNAIDRFGVQAVTGRLTLGAKEIRLMAIAENVVEAYKDRDRAPDLGEWVSQNLDRSNMLLAAQSKAIEFGFIKGPHA